MGKVAKVQVAQGTVPDPLIVQVMDEEGDPIDLSDARRARFRMQSRRGEPLIDSRGRVADPEQGHIAYDWGRGDLRNVTPRVYDAAFKIRFDDGRTLVAPTDGRLVIDVADSSFDN